MSTIRLEGSAETVAANIIRRRGALRSGNRMPYTRGRVQVSHGRGFTLIKLLIVTIIAILAAIAILTYANVKEKEREKEYIAAMTSDLRNVATYEDQYAAESRGAYFGGTATAASPLEGFTPSQNVTVTVTNTAGPPRSWTATATHTQTAKSCAIANGVITCT